MCVFLLFAWCAQAAARSGVSVHGRTEEEVVLVCLCGDTQTRVWGVASFKHTKSSQIKMKHSYKHNNKRLDEPVELFFPHLLFFLWNWFIQAAPFPLRAIVRLIKARKRKLLLPVDVKRQLLLLSDSFPLSKEIPKPIVYAWTPSLPICKAYRGYLGDMDLNGSQSYFCISHLSLECLSEPVCRRRHIFPSLFPFISVFFIWICTAR